MSFQRLFAKGGMMEWRCVHVRSGSVRAGQHHVWHDCHRVVDESAHSSCWCCCGGRNTERVGRHSRSGIHHHRRGSRHERHRGCWSGCIRNEHRSLDRLRRHGSARTGQLVHGRCVAPRLARQRQIVDVDIQAADIAPRSAGVGSSCHPNHLQSSSHQKIKNEKRNVTAST